MKEHHYRVLENHPCGTWRIEELFGNNIVRSPFKSREEAIAKEETIIKSRYEGIPVLRG